METLTAIFNPQPLIEARKARSLTVVQVANSVGVGQSTITDIETGRRKPSLPLLAKLCRFLNISMESLFFFDKNNDNSDKVLDKYR
jgi:putative transcriptional regulator